MKKFLFLAAVLALCAGCTQTYRYSWRSHVVDAHRTGVTIATADNVPEAMGTVEDGVYTAPNGRVFDCGATPAVAYHMISFQPRMADLKTVIGHCDEDMVARTPESTLSNWAVDEVMRKTAEVTGKKVDVGIINIWGIRSAFTKGDIIKDDVDSMFPFRNYLCYVDVPGAELLEIFEHFAKSKLEVVGGVNFVIKDRAIEKLEIGGEPFDVNKHYGVATIDFLLDGGDSLTIAKNARELIITKEKVGDVMMDYVIRTEAAGKAVSYQKDGRVTIIKEDAE